MPDDVFMAAEAMVEARGWTRSRLYADAMRQYLKHQDPAEITARLDQVHPGPDEARDLRKQTNRAVLGASDW